VIITTAHLDRNQANNARENLAALCQRCHLRHDIHQHIANRRYGRNHAGPAQMKLI
jgi:5-methylcytosine-specific restriction endonuclease McrA